MLNTIKKIFSAIGVILGIIATAVALVALMVLLFYPLNRYECSQLGKNVSIETEYHLFGGGCLLSIDGEKIPSSKWKYNSGN